MSGSSTRLRTNRELIPSLQIDGSANIAAELKKALHRMIVDLKVTSYQTVPCLISEFGAWESGH